MIQIMNSIEWDMGHRIPNHGGKCSTPHGHRYKLEVTVRGELQTTPESQEDMLIDFSQIKGILRNCIYNKLDHCFLASDKDPFLHHVRNFDDFKKLKFVSVPFIPTAERIVKWCFDNIACELPSYLTLYKCRLYEGSNSWAEFRGN